MGKIKEIIGIASDHGGFKMKEFIKEKLQAEGYEIQDFGTHSDDSVDYPDFIHPLSHLVDRHELNRGIIICGSGNGAQITANKYPNVRAGLCWDVEQARLTRAHNDANILSLPGRFVSLEDAWLITQTFLNTAFEGGRHAVRVSKISKTIN